MWTVEQRHQYNAAYYRTHRASEIQRVRSRQRATLEFLRDLRRRPCSDCGQTFPPWVMDFDHRDPCDKSFPHTTGRALLKSRAALMLEIAKCDVVCANCHAFRTYRQMQARKNGLPPEMSAPGKSDYIEKKRERWRLNAQLLRDLCDVPCADCGIRFPSFCNAIRSPRSDQEEVHRLADHHSQSRGDSRGGSQMRRCLRELPPDPDVLN